MSLGSNHLMQQITGIDNLPLFSCGRIPNLTDFCIWVRPRFADRSSYVVAAPLRALHVQQLPFKSRQPSQRHEQAVSRRVPVEHK